MIERFFLDRIKPAGDHLAITLGTHTPIPILPDSTYPVPTFVNSTVVIAEIAECR